MGVTGLWRLIEPAGKPVPVETLENKVLAVDISIWLHQMVKGYQDAKGAPLPNAHLMGLFQRLCKLLYFRIKPVFVFDGGFPELKKETIAKRQDHKNKYNSESERIKRELALLLSKKTAVNSLLGKQISPSKQQPTSSANNDDLFKLPALPQREEESESESEDERDSSSSSIDLHTVDLESENFKNLPVKEKYDILMDLKETRKQNSWGKLQELPKKSDNFSDFQMQRLLKRRKVQECIEETEKEMGDTGMSLNDLENLLNEEGIDTKIDTLPTKRIASNVTSRFLLIKDIKQALANAKMKEQLENKPEQSNVVITEISETNEKPKVDELEDDLQKAIKMSLECVEEQPANTVSKTDDSWTSCMTDTDSEYSGTDSEEGDGFEQPDISCAKAYIMQYSDFTHKAINELVHLKKAKNKQKLPKVDEIIDEINKEKSVIIDNVELSSSDDDCIIKMTEQASESNNQMDVTLNIVHDDTEKPNETLNATQASVVCIENPVTETITLESSTEDTDNEADKLPQNIEFKRDCDLSENEGEKVTTINSKEETDSSESEFEEVPTVETKENKPIVELTLNMGDAPDDDIFADVFAEPRNTNVNCDIIKAEEHCEAPQPDANKTPIENIEKTNNLYSKSDVVSPVKPDNIINSSEAHKITPALDTKQTNKPSDSELSTELKEATTKNNVTTQKSLLESINTSTTYNNNLNSAPKEVINTEKLNTMVEEIQNQEQDLLKEKGRLDRVGRNITEQMTKEAQELLQIFGIPYIVAPMEAEAQCAFLESVKLTDGTITDDSDIWLFGGRTVYKNFFNQKKHVLQYQAERIETSFNLSREQLVLLALLVGSDYTTGVTGIGPVTAMEILASFPFSRRQLREENTKHDRYLHIIKGLQEFKQWVKAGKRTDNTSLKKKLKNVLLTDDFPSVRVVQAYLDPNVEKSEDKFSWGEIDITVLRDYTKAKFGWSQNKLDEIIKPVLKRIIERKTQRTMQDFFKRKIEFQSLEEQMSKRVKAAVQRMGPENSSLENVVIAVKNTEEKAKSGVKRKAAKPSTKTKAGPSARKQTKNEDTVLLNQGVKMVSLVNDDGKSEFEIKIQKTDRFQEIIPQREKDKKSLLENKLKAIELFRKTQIDKKKKTVKRKALKPKEKAELSETDSD